MFARRPFGALSQARAKRGIAVRQRNHGAARKLWSLLSCTTGSNATRQVVLETRKNNVRRAVAGPSKARNSRETKEPLSCEGTVGVSGRHPLFASRAVSDAKKRPGPPAGRANGPGLRLQPGRSRDGGLLGREGGAGAEKSEL